MAVLERSALVAYGADDMFRLVGDIEAYPEFLPGCVGARVEEAQADAVRARLAFAVRGIRDSFVTHNRMEDGRRIEVTLLEGPFRRLAGAWHFQPLAEAACKVTLRLDVDFNSRLLEAALGPWLEQGVGAVLEAFHGRAAQIYGR